MSTSIQVDLLDLPTEEAVGLYLFRYTTYIALGLQADRVIWTPCPQGTKVFLSSRRNLPWLPSREQSGAEFPWPLSTLERGLFELTRFSPAVGGPLMLVVKGVQVPVLVHQSEGSEGGLVFNIGEHGEINLPRWSIPPKPGYRASMFFRGDRVNYRVPERWWEKWTSLVFQTRGASQRI